MALKSTVIGTAAVSVYTSIGNTVVTSMYLCNTGNVAVQFNIYAVPAGYNLSDTKLIYYQVPLTPKDTYVIDTEKLVLEHNDKIYANIKLDESSLIVGLGDTDWGFSNVNSVFWANDRTEYIVVGDSGKIAISQTGESWDYQNGAITLGWPVSVPANDITKINLKRYVVVGNEGWIASSIDGKTWTGQTGLTSSPWGQRNVNAITNNGVIYLAVGNDAGVATSVDGLTWSFQPGLGLTAWGNSNVYTALWDGNRFVIGGDSGKIATSVDGSNWVYSNVLAVEPAWGSSTRLTTLVYSGSVVTGYLALSKDNAKVAFSSDLTTWEYDSNLAAITVSTPGVMSATFKVNYGFYAIGMSGEIFYRGLGGIWQKIDSLLVPPWGALSGGDILWNQERSEFIAVGAGGRVATSADGITWTYTTESPPNILVVPDVVVTVSSIAV